MHKILEKRRLSNDVERGQDVFYFKVMAPEIARNRKAGQFIIFQIDDNFGERVPLTIADANAEEGWIAIVFQTVGASTYKLAADFDRWERPRTFRNLKKLTASPAQSSASAEASALLRCSRLFRQIMQSVIMLLLSSAREARIY